MAYAREKFLFMEIGRRFCIKNSKDPDVRKFRMECLKDGVPEEALNSERWDYQVNRVAGGGNKVLEVAIAKEMLGVMPMHGPEAQTIILRNFDAAVTGDWKLANLLTPDGPKVTDSIHDTEIAFGAIMAGSMLSPKAGLNAIEVITTMIRLMSAKVAQIQQTGGVGDMRDIQGLGNAIKYTEGFVQQLEGDKSQKELAKKANDALGKIGNEVKAFAQRFHEQQQKQAEASSGMDPKDLAKIQAIMLTAQAKAKIATDSAAQRTAQRQLQFEAKQKQAAEKHAQDLMQTGAENALANGERRKNLFEE
jgi:hypothetical protein